MDIHGHSAHILVNGRKVKEYRHNGLTFIEAKDGTEFSIEVKNHQYNRVLAIVSVDGLDVIDGKPATKKSRGYIVNGNNADVFHGWRKSDTEVGAFKFVTGDKSYATEKGKGQNNGVIAIKLIAEKEQLIQTWINSSPVVPHIDPWVYPKLPTYPTFPQRPYVGDPQDITYTCGGTSTSARAFTGNTLRGAKGSSAGSIQSANYCAVQSDVQDAGNFDMGTTWGSKREDKVTTTDFEYGNEIGTFEFYYASREALKAMGIPLINERQVPKLPEAFEGTGYAQPPKNWRA